MIQTIANPILQSIEVQIYTNLLIEKNLTSVLLKI
jgi:hypothetical protein